MTCGKFMQACILVVLGVYCGVAGAQLPGAQGGAQQVDHDRQRAVQHNPFIKPDLGGSGEQPDVQDKREEPQKILRLRAVLYSSTAPLVNINGKILTVGEHIEGFQIQEVGEDSAILSKDDVQIMLSTNEDQQSPGK